MTGCPRRKAKICSLVNQYNRIDLQAQSASLYGLRQDASELYLQAFDLSVFLFDLTGASSESLRRCTDACMNCYEYGSCGGQEEDIEYLFITGDILYKTIRKGCCESLRLQALESYVDVAAMAEVLVRMMPSPMLTETLEQFRSAWESHSCQLIHRH